MTDHVTVPLALVREVASHHHPNNGAGLSCEVCWEPWPCPAARLLDAAHTSPEVSPTLLSLLPDDPPAHTEHTQTRSLKRCAGCGRRWPCPDVLNETIPPGDAHEAAFLEAWESYPKRNGRRGSKKVARQKWHRLVKPGNAAAVLEAVRNYAEHVALADEFPADMSTWLNQERWEDYAEPTDPADLKRGRSQADLNTDRGEFVY